MLTLPLLCLGFKVLLKAPITFCEKEHRAEAVEGGKSMERVERAGVKRSRGRRDCGKRLARMLWEREVVGLTAVFWALLSLLGVSLWKLFHICLLAVFYHL